MSDAKNKPENTKENPEGSKIVQNGKKDKKEKQEEKKVELEFPIEVDDLTRFQCDLEFLQCLTNPFYVECRS